MSADLDFILPWVFLLLPLPLLAYLLIPAARREQALLYMPLLHEGKITTTTGTDTRPDRKAITFMALIWLLAVTAAAGPVRIGDTVELPRSGRDLLLAIDISGSMQIEDMSLNGTAVDRLTLVKKVVADFVQRRQGDRLGLILFGSNAYIQAPLTFDLPTVAQLLNEAQIGFAGDATAIGDAIGLAIKRLASNPADSRVLILMTDGQNTAGAVAPQQAAGLAHQENVVIYTIGIGSDQIMSTGFLGMNRFNPSRDLDEKTLIDIAESTGGQYFRARNQTELDGIYNAIDKLEAIEQKAEPVRPQQALFHWPLGAAMLLALLAASLQKWRNLARWPA